MACPTGAAVVPANQVPTTIPHEFWAGTNKTIKLPIIGIRARKIPKKQRESFK
jgi:hypothetical protein